jgi:uncharacterized membrane protein YfcA
VVGRASRAAHAVIGFVGGLTSGLLGVGGGVVMVPAMVLWLARSQREAHAISLAAIVPMSLASAIVYGSAGKIDLDAALAMAVGAVVGAPLGARALAEAPERPLKAAFGCLLLVAASVVAIKSQL